MADLAPLVAAAAALVTALAGLIATLLNGRKISEVHTIVNHQHDVLIERINQLTKALEGSDTDVPVPVEAVADPV